MNTPWVFIAEVGEISIADGLSNSYSAAFQVISCFAISTYYDSSPGRKDILSQEITIGGHRGWRLRSELYVATDDLPQGKGDWVDVIVVDVGLKGSLATFISNTTIGNDQHLNEVEAAIAS